MRFTFTRSWPFIVRTRATRSTAPEARRVRFGADSCVDLALYGADEVTAAGHRSDSERFNAALVAWRMLETASEEKKGDSAVKRIGMRSNPFASARLFVRMLKRAGLDADIRKTPKRDTVPCVVVVTIDGSTREVSMTMLKPVEAAQVHRRPPRRLRRPSQAA